MNPTFTLVSLARALDANPKVMRARARRYLRRQRLVPSRTPDPRRNRRWIFESRDRAQVQSLLVAA